MAVPNGYHHRSSTSDRLASTTCTTPSDSSHPATTTPFSRSSRRGLLRVSTIDRVLLNRATAEGIADGTITLVLRRWDAPRAKAGGTQRTPVGTIHVDAVTDRPGGCRVSASEAIAAGYPGAKAAQSDLGRRPS